MQNEAIYGPGSNRHPAKTANEAFAWHVSGTGAVVALTKIKEKSRRLNDGGEVNSLRDLRTGLVGAIQIGS